MAGGTVLGTYSDWLSQQLGLFRQRNASGCHDIFDVSFHFWLSRCKIEIIGSIVSAVPPTNRKGQKVIA